ncbi:MAG: oligosaccharide flippase family protein [Candidatus Marinimicrobia bacterium]|nr:oligosaccharide flippase family protein [Candidatus Neomarinimicrobiota bacterium]MCF7850493.1 oligosaccharide flippase family protein [Candidatus Neomarinimicrobiota bacterium]
MSTLRQIMTSPYLRNILIMFRGTSIGQALPILAFPLLSRIYLPETIGAYAVVFALATILGGIAGMRLEFALITAREEDRFVLIQIILRAMWPLALFYIIVVAGVGNLLNVEVLNLKLETLVFLIMLIILNLCFNTSQYFNTSFERFSVNSNSRVILAAGTVVFQILGGLIFDGMLISLFVGRIVAFVLALLFSVKNIDLSQMLKKGSQSFGTVLERYLPFIKFYWPSSLIDLAALHAPVILIGGLFSSAWVGQYSFAYRGVSVPTATFGQAISQVFFKRFTDRVNSFGKDPRTLLGTWGVLASIGLLPFTALFLWGESIVPFILGQNWAEAGRIVSIISPMALLMFISSPTSTALLTLGKQKYALIFSISQLIYKVGALYYGALIEDLYLGLIILTVCHSIQIIAYNITIYLFMMRNSKDASNGHPELVS